MVVRRGVVVLRRRRRASGQSVVEGGGGGGGGAGEAEYKPVPSDDRTTDGEAADDAEAPKRQV